LRYLRATNVIAAPYKATPAAIAAPIATAEDLTGSLFPLSAPNGAAPPAAPADVVAAADTEGDVPSIGWPAMSGIAGLIKDMRVATVASGLLYIGEFGVCRSTASWFTISDGM